MNSFKIHKDQLKLNVARKGFGVLVAATLIVSGLSNATAYAASVSQISTGATFACAVDNGVAKCWGSNENGELGNRSTTDSATPVKVYADAAKAAYPTPCGGWFQPACNAAVPASPIKGKYIEKVSAGLTHACALSDAKVYCWGDNSYGQLGNRSNTNSTVPVAVDVKSKDVTPAPYKETKDCGGWLQSACKTIMPAPQPKSALSTKEVVDIAAGEYFTCALASDGTVSCWGLGENGRLGTNSMDSVNYPKAVYSAGALNGQKGIKLAKANGSTMCVLTVPLSFSDSPSGGSPYCWGFGIDDGTAVPPNGSGTVACGKNSPTTKPTASSTFTEVIYSESSQPVKVAGNSMKTIKGYGYMTSMDTGGRAYYWGMYGIKATTSSFSDIKSCTVNTCVSSAGNRITLAATTKSGNDASTKNRAKAVNNARNSNSGGGDKNKNLNSNNAAQQAALNAARGGVSTTISATGGGITTNYTLGGYGWGPGANGATIGQGYTSITTHVGSYAGIARPNGGNYGPGASVGNNKDSCGTQTHYGYTKNSTYERVGKNAATVPPSWPQSQAGITALAGNAYDGLFCAKVANALSCDAHGTSVKEGQTGSGYTEQCSGPTLFTAKVCQPAPAGPQAVTATGWLNGKSITEVETGISGYSCAIADGAVGCWGLNDYGQLGNGSKTNKNVPTAVASLQ